MVKWFRKDFMSTVPINDIMGTLSWNLSFCGLVERKKNIITPEKFVLWPEMEIGPFLINARKVPQWWFVQRDTRFQFVFLLSKLLFLPSKWYTSDFQTWNKKIKTKNYMLKSCEPYVEWKFYTDIINTLSDLLTCFLFFLRN